LAILALAPFAAAARADLVDSLAGAAAPRTGGDVDKPAEDRLLHLPDLTPAVAGRAGRYRGPRLGARSLAPLAGLEPRHRHHALATLDRIEEIDLDLHAQIGAAHRPARLATAKVAAEECLAEIADVVVAIPVIIPANGRGFPHRRAMAARHLGRSLDRRRLLHRPGTASGASRYAGSRPRRRARAVRAAPVPLHLSGRRVHDRHRLAQPVRERPWRRAPPPRHPVVVGDPRRDRPRGRDLHRLARAPGGLGQP